MIDRDAEWVARAAGGELRAGDPRRPGPRRAVVDSRELREGDLFAGIPGARVDGGEFAAGALAAGAWGVLVDPARAAALADAPPELLPRAAVIAAPDTAAALASLARAWRRELGCPAVAITGSTGKTSTKDILAALLRPQLPATHASRENLNTEIGLPLAILEASRGTEALVLELAMRGPGQIAELAAIAEPQVGVVLNVGPVHLELLGTVERVAAAKAELVRDLPAGAACVVPADEPLLESHLRDDLDTIAFGPGGDVRLASFDAPHARIDARGREVELELPYAQPYNLANTLAAVAATTALGVTPSGPVEVSFSSLRGEVVELPGGVTVVNDCYNANPMSMRAALDDLAQRPAERRVAVLGEMAELGPDGPRLHREVGAHARGAGVELLIAVGGGALALAEGFAGVGGEAEAEAEAEATPANAPAETRAADTPEQARALLERLAAPGDVVLVKGSRSAGLERVLV